MSDSINTVGKTLAPGFQWSAGVAYIALPSDIDRGVYINDCYKNSKVSIWTEDGGFLNRVPIDIDVLNYIEFPTIPKEFGTAVVYITEPVHNQPIVIGRLPKTEELGELKENQFKIKRKLNNKLVEISGSAESGMLNLSVNSDNRAGGINIMLTNLNDNGELNVEVAGKVNMSTSKEVQFVQKERFFVNTVGQDDQDDSDASFEQTSEENRFNGKKFVLNKGDEPFLLGQKTIDFLDKFIDKVAAIQTITKLGLQPIVNKVEVLALKKELRSLISKEAFLKQ